jgi:hypothetical protein
MLTRLHAHTHTHTYTYTYTQKEVETKAMVVPTALSVQFIWTLCHLLCGRSAAAAGPAQVG